MFPDSENTSGHGPSSDIPLEVRGWNWGAFFLSWIWGLSNGVYISLLCFIPLLSPIMIFVLGLKGSEWAWRNKRWASVHDFRRTQKKWAIAGFVLVLLGIFAGIATVVLGGLLVTQTSSMVDSTFKKTAPYKKLAGLMENDPRLKAALGDNIVREGMPTGDFKIENDRGRINMTFPVKGSKASGKLHIVGRKAAGDWSWSKIELILPDSAKAINLIDVAGDSNSEEEIDIKPDDSARSL
ncbi:MAG: cytochrome c oxidase assembly factor Coa1 family protein [Cyanobacteriota/Melainabacteria group bacterium]